MASRGSVIPLFVEQMQRRPAAHGHRPEHDAVHDVARRSGRPRALRLRAWPHRRHLRAEGAGRRRSATWREALQRICSSRDTPIQVIGTRHGEKLYETLVSAARRWRAAEDLGDYYRIPADARDLNYDKYFVEGETEITEARRTTPRTTPSGSTWRDGAAAAEARFIRASSRRTSALTHDSSPKGARLEGHDRSSARGRRSSGCRG